MVSGERLPSAEGIALISRDVSAEQELEQRRGELILQLETTNRLKDDFLATLAHELRNPLNSLLGWAAMMRDGTAPASRALPLILSNANALNGLVGELLDSSRIVSGKLRTSRRLSPTRLTRSGARLMRGGLRLRSSLSSDGCGSWATLRACVRSSSTSSTTR
jgi:signal transduction histidine kinase